MAARYSVASRSCSAAASGAAAEVPQNGSNRNIVVLTQSAAVRSGGSIRSGAKKTFVAASSAISSASCGSTRSMRMRGGTIPRATPSRMLAMAVSTQALNPRARLMKSRKFRAVLNGCTLAPEPSWPKVSVAQSNWLTGRR